MGQGAQGRVVRQGLPEGAEGGPDAGVGGGPVLEWRREATTMDIFLPILAIVMATAGMILLLGSIAVLFWTLWKGWVVAPSRRAAPSAAVKDQTGTVSGE